MLDVEALSTVRLKVLVVILLLFLPKDGRAFIYYSVYFQKNGSNQL